MRPIDALDGAVIQRLNAAHAWRTYVVDGSGRRVGNPDGRLHKVPSDHALQCDRWVGLSGKSVVEFGCHEGTHTITLAERAHSVVAIDARQENLEKTRVRCQLFGVTPEVRLVDLDREPPPAADLYFHVGVLYHLKDPVKHISLFERAKFLYLDTHYAEKPGDRYVSSDGREYPCGTMQEDPSKCQAGMGSFARWLGNDLLIRMVGTHFPFIKILSMRRERFGPRLTLVGWRE